MIKMTPLWFGELDNIASIASIASIAPTHTQKCRKNMVFFGIVNTYVFTHYKICVCLYNNIQHMCTCVDAEKNFVFGFLLFFAIEKDI